MNQFLNTPVPSFYDRVGIANPDKAFARARKNVGFYRHGRWVRQWWNHPVEAQAVLLTGIFIMKGPDRAYAYELYQENYKKIATEMSSGDYLDYPDSENIRGHLSLQEHQQWVEKLKQVIG